MGLRAALMAVAATPEEIRTSRAGDSLVAEPDSVMNRGFILAAPPETVWPWIVQLGKARGGWYLPHTIERFLPPARRAVRSVDDQWQSLAPGDVIPDYGGPRATFEAVTVDPPRALVYRSERGAMSVSWSIHLTDVGVEGPPRTRVHLRLRLGPIRNQWLANTGGELIDLLTIAGVAAGLRERVAESPEPPWR